MSTTQIESFKTGSSHLAALAQAAASGDQSAVEQLADFLAENYPSAAARFGTFYQVGRRYMWRTISDHYTGVLIDQNAAEFLIADWAWIPEMGNFHNALINPDGFSDVEPGTGCTCHNRPGTPLILHRQALVAAPELIHDVPRAQKPSLPT